MLENKYDIVMQQGSNYELSLIVKNPDNSVKNLTDYSARMQIRSSYSSSTIAVSLSTDTGGLTIIPLTGTIVISLTAEQTANIKVDLSNKGKPPSSLYVYDLELIDDDQKVSKLIYGDVTVYAEVTR